MAKPTLAAPYFEPSQPVEPQPTPPRIADRPTLRLVQRGGVEPPRALGRPGAAEPARPFIKWVGGKTRLLAELERLRPYSIDRYSEPFVGGGALYFALRNASAFSAAVISDFNPDVVNAYTVVRDHPMALLAALRRHQALYLSRDEQDRATYFYAVRDRHPQNVDMTAIERAARMLFLNRTCYNGLWRENLSGRFNTPHGRYKAPVIAPTDRVLAASAALAVATIERADFRRLPQLAADHDVDFVYLDPPYHPLSATSAFNAYSQGAFTGADQADLADVCRELDRMGVRWMLSNSDCPLIRELYDGFDIRQVFAPRSVNCDAAKRGNVAEVIVRNKRSGLTW